MGIPEAGALYPLSVKGVLFRDSRVCLLENERREWELPGGRPEIGETEQVALSREFEEELGLIVTVHEELGTWLYEPLHGRHVRIRVYRCQEAGRAAERLSSEHLAVRWFPPEDLTRIPLPDCYGQAIERARRLEGGRSRPVGNL